MSGLACACCCMQAVTRVLAELYELHSRLMALDAVARQVQKSLVSLSCSHAHKTVLLLDLHLVSMPRLSSGAHYL